MGTIKDKNNKILTEPEEINKMWQEYTEELFLKGLNEPCNHDGAFTHLESNILEHQVKWALRNLIMSKASKSDGITAELFKILKDDAVKVLCSIVSQFAKLSSSHRTGKDQLLF